MDVNVATELNRIGASARTTSAMMPSPFFDRSRWVSENNHAFAIRDIFPVSVGHTLVIPKREVVSIFDLSVEEVTACWSLVAQQRDELMRTLQPAPDAFNVGINDGALAGQTISHAHIHLIPRYRGDHPNPRGGVRAVIPGKGPY
jgi:diadenosine tetraphosphate (Ap4A) HIT family hydrolase